MANVKTLRDIILNPDTRLSPSQMRETYGVSGTYHDENNVAVARNIDKVTINGNVFTDYSAFSFLWEKSYVSSPTRSGNGSYATLENRLRSYVYRQLPQVDATHLHKQRVPCYLL